MNHTYNAISNSARSISPEPSLSICLKYFATWGEGWWYGRTKVVNGGLDEWGAALAHAHLCGGQENAKRWQHGAKLIVVNGTAAVDVKLNKHLRGGF